MPIVLLDVVPAHGRASSVDVRAGLRYAGSTANSSLLVSSWRNCPTVVGQTPSRDTGSARPAGNLTSPNRPACVPEPHPLIGLACCQCFDRPACVIIFCPWSLTDCKSRTRIHGLGVGIVGTSQCVDSADSQVVILHLTMRIGLLDNEKALL